MDHVSPQPVALPPARRTLSVVGFVLVGAATLALAYVAISDVLLAIAVGGVAGLACWMLVTDRYEQTLVVLLVYLGLADGFLKLRLDRPGVTLLRDALLYAIVLGAIARWVSRRESFRWPPYSAWVVAWVGVVLIQLANRADGDWQHAVAALRPHLEFVPLFFLGYELMRNERRLRTFFIVLAAVAGINGAVAIYQVQLTPADLATWGPGYAKLTSGEGDLSPRAFIDSHGIVHPRPPGLGGDMGFSGALGALAAPGVLALMWTARRRRRLEFAVVVLLAGGVAVAVAVSASRLAVIQSGTSLVAMAILAVIASRRLGHALAVAAIAVLLVAGGSVLFSQTKSGIFDRYKSITPEHVVRTAYNYKKGALKQVPTYAQDFPFGAGLGSVGPGASSDFGHAQSKGLNGETEYTFLLVEVGIAGLLLLLAFHLRLLGLSLARVNRLPAANTRVFLAALVSAIFGLFVAWFAGPTTATSPAGPFLWFAAGTLVFWLGDWDRGDGPQARSQVGSRAFSPSADLPASSR